ncbi:hypothetical protein, partial [Streptococcus pseudopneumoniae]|uniref:RipA family octameric membrane protein n=1 Tax=Streptococcus pseudopneumoniae TaxID=257758 RepID=UPI00148739EF
GSVLCDNVSVGNTVVTGYVNSHTEPQQSDSRVDIVKILIEALHRQLDLFWRRNQMFLTTTGILFAAAAIIIEAGDGSDISALLCLCIFGLIVSLGWVQVCLIGKAECDRVAEDLRETLEKDVEMRRCFKTWFEDRQGSGRRDSGTMVALQIIAVLSAALWLGIAIG